MKYINKFQIILLLVIGVFALSLYIRNYSHVLVPYGEKNSFQNMVILDGRCFVNGDNFKFTISDTLPTFCLRVPKSVQEKYHCKLIEYGDTVSFEALQPVFGYAMVVSFFINDLEISQKYFESNLQEEKIVYAIAILAITAYFILLLFLLYKVISHGKTVNKKKQNEQVSGHSK